MRDKIIKEILKERETQIKDRGFTEDSDDLRHGPNEWIAMLARQVGLAGNDGDQEFDGVRFRRQMIRTAAMALAAIESFDRKSQKVAGKYEAGSGY